MSEAEMTTLLGELLAKFTPHQAFALLVEALVKENNLQTYPLVSPDRPARNLMLQRGFSREQFENLGGSSRGNKNQST